MRVSLSRLSRAERADARRSHQRCGHCTYWKMHHPVCLVLCLRNSAVVFDHASDDRTGVVGDPDTTGPVAEDGRVHDVAAPHGGAGEGLVVGCPGQPTTRPSPAPPCGAATSWTRPSSATGPVVSGSPTTPVRSSLAWSKTTALFRRQSTSSAHRQDLAESLDGPAATCSDGDTSPGRRDFNPWWAGPGDAFSHVAGVSAVSYTHLRAHE